MYRRFVYFLVLILVLSLSHEIALAEDYDISISGASKNFYSSPTAAVNTRNGDLLVAYEKSDNNQSKFREIYVVRLKNKKGKLSAGKPTLISDKSFMSESPAVAYNPEKNQYLVVWSAFRKNKKNIVFWDVYGRALKSNGKTIGGVKEILKFNSVDFQDPKILFNDFFDEVNPSAQSIHYFLLWSQTDNSGNGAGDSGIYNTFLKTDGTPFFAPVQVVQKDFDDSTSFFSDLFTGDLIKGPDNAVYLSFIQEEFFGSAPNPSAKSTTFARVVKMSSVGFPEKRADLSQGDDLAKTGLTALSKKAILSSYVDSGKRELRNQAFKRNLKKFKKEFQPVDSSDVFDSSFASLPNGGAYQVINPNGAFGVKYKSNGKIDSKKSIDVPFLAPFFSVVALPDGKQVMIMTRDDSSSNVSEIRGYIIDI